MIRDISYLTLAFVYVNILGYFFHSIVSRSLGPSGYGEFMVLYSFMLTVGNITAILGTVGVKVILENFERRYDFLRSLRKMALFLGVIFATLVMLFSSFLRDFLHVSNSYYFFLIALAWLGMFLLAIEKSFLQSTGRFPLFAFCNSAELTIRFLITILMLLMGFRISGVLFASVLGIYSVIIFLVFGINREILGESASLEAKKILKIALYVSPSGFFVYADDIFIRRIFDEYTAGLYASVSIVGKVLLWFTLTMLGVYFPKFVESKHSLNFKKFVGQIIGIVLLAEIIGQIGIFFIGKPLFLLLFGKKFEGALIFLPSYLFFILPLLFSIVLISLATALEKGMLFIYFHLFFFYLGFIFLKFKSINDYLHYIFLLNAFFVLLYLWKLKLLRPFDAIQNKS